MATVTVERERRDANRRVVSQDSRSAGVRLGGSSTRREFGSAGAQRSTPAMMSSTVRPAKASMSRRLA
jgi:hypothetical protein